MIRMELFKILIHEGDDQHVIVLRECDGERTFPIVIGYFEALAIDRRIKNFRAPRPLTHDLLNNLITELGGVLERVVINDLRDGTFYARLGISLEGRDIEVDARPSDAIALASLDSTPIFVEEAVLDEAGQSPI